MLDSAVSWLAVPEVLAGGGDLDLKAASVTTSVASATPRAAVAASGSDLGVGASFAVNIEIAHTRAESEHRLFDKALEHAKRSGPFVLRAPRGEYQVFTPYRFAVDMQVVHQRYPIDPQTGRPQWLQTLAGFTAREVPAHLLPNEGKRLVAARPAGQPEDAIPADVVTVEAGKPAPRFMLPPGDYIYSYLE